MASRSNPIYRALNRPLTILGAERKLFFVAVTMGAAVFNLLNSLLGGLLVAGFLYFLARWATTTEPQILRFIFKAAASAPSTTLQSSRSFRFGESAMRS